MDITLDTPIIELLHEVPDAANILINYGMHCIGCGASLDENLGEACAAHEMSNEECLQLLSDLNNRAAYEKIKEKSKDLVIKKDQFIDGKLPATKLMVIGGYCETEEEAKDVLDNSPISVNGQRMTSSVVFAIEQFSFSDFFLKVGMDEPKILKIED